MKTGWTVERLVELLEPTLSAAGYEIHDLKVSGPDPGSLVRLTLDSNSGISLDDCERASNLASVLLDQADPFAGRYILEVSSPGIDRKLRVPADYQRQLGRRIEVHHREGEGERVVTGRLIEVGSDYVLLEVRGGERAQIELETVLSARPVIEFGSAR